MMPVTDAEVAMARLAGIVECPGAHPDQYDIKCCLICQGAGTVSTEGKTTDTIRFWIAWKRRND